MHPKISSSRTLSLTSRYSVARVATSHGSLCPNALSNVVMAARSLFYRKFSNNITKSAINEKLILYGDEVSPPVRFVMMTAFILGVKLDFRHVNLFASENKTESYRKINPLQKVPSLVIQNQKLCDSHAISLYLCRKWDTEHALYPQDNFTKAKVDEILFFNSSTLFPIDSEIFTTFFARSAVSESKIKDWYKALDFLEHRLQNQLWLGGDRMLLCDVCAVSTITSMSCLMPLSDNYIRLNQWMSEFEKQPFFNINRKGLERLERCINAAKNEIPRDK